MTIVKGFEVHFDHFPIELIKVRLSMFKHNISIAVDVNMTTLLGFKVSSLAFATHEEKNEVLYLNFKKKKV